MGAVCTPSDSKLQKLLFIVISMESHKSLVYPNVVRNVTFHYQIANFVFYRLLVLNYINV